MGIIRGWTQSIKKLGVTLGTKSIKYILEINQFKWKII